MFEIKPLRDNVIDPATGHPMAKKGVRVSALYPADYLAQRQGDVSIEELTKPEVDKKPAKPKP